MTEAAGQPIPGFNTPEQAAAATFPTQEKKITDAGAAAQAGIGGEFTGRVFNDAGAEAAGAAAQATSSDQNAAAIARQQIAGQASAASNLSNVISGAGGLLGGITNAFAKG